MLPPGATIQPCSVQDRVAKVRECQESKIVSMKLISENGSEWLHNNCGTHFKHLFQPFMDNAQMAVTKVEEVDVTHLVTPGDHSGWHSS